MPFPCMQTIHSNYPGSILVYSIIVLAPGGNFVQDVWTSGISKYAFAGFEIVEIILDIDLATSQ